MRRDESLDPSKLKKPPGRTPQHAGDDILKLLTGDGLTTTKWAKAAERRGVSRRTFYRLKNTLEDSKRITQAKDKWTPA
jgi:DNA-binding IclR family transcriptional regulator